MALGLLRRLSRRVFKRYQPQVVVITGSYGKTSTKDAVAAVLRQAYVLRSSPKSFNNEYGVPFTVIGAPDAGHPIVRWSMAFWLAFKLLVSRQPYPSVLVLEFGGDKPGDIKDLLKLVVADIGVVTSIGPTHLERYKSVATVYAEESLVATTLNQHGWAILNCDDPFVRRLCEQSPCRIVSYGFSAGVAVRCMDAAPAQGSKGEWGMMLKIRFGQDEFPVFLPGVTGRHSAYAALAAVATAVALHLDEVEITQGLQEYDPPPGRMRVLPGIKRTWLIDDSYNSSPDAGVAAIDALREFPAEGKRYAVLGDMVDLGSATESSHRRVGQEIVDEDVDVFVAVGESMQAAASEARARGMPKDRIFTFNDAATAGRAVQDMIKEGDVVLVKGSQVSRMEKVVKELMAEPERAGELLVRQDARWLRT